MSTKVYTGLRFKAMPISEFTLALKPIVAQIKARQAERQAIFLAEYGTALLDARTIAQMRGETVDCTRAPYNEAYSALFERQHELRATHRRDPEIDFEVIIRLWFCQETQCFIGYVLDEDQGFTHKLLIKSGLAEEYGYWNNTDKPRRITAKEWKERARIWDALLDGESDPWFDIKIDKPGFPDMALVSRHVPSMAKRCHDQAKNWIATDWMREHANGTELDGAEVDAQEAMRLYMRFLTALRKEPAVAERVAQKAHELADILPKKSTFKKVFFNL